jgi:hypothetical protein
MRATVNLAIEVAGLAFALTPALVSFILMFRLK